MRSVLLASPPCAQYSVSWWPLFRLASGSFVYHLILAVLVFVQPFVSLLSWAMLGFCAIVVFSQFGPTILEGHLPPN